MVTKTVFADGPARVQVRLSGAAGDWDVALFGAHGRALAAGASPDAQEVANGWTAEPATLQACRLSGARAATAVVSQTPITTKAERAQLVSVRTPTRADKQRLVALGLDMTEHGGTRSLGVVLHGAADAATLRRHGFTWRVLVDDLAARSARDLAAPAAATTLPSGRTSYRTLADYESEMKALAAQNPGLVRLFTLPNRRGAART